ncbi:FAD-dependent oxidoreductase [Vibrio sp. SCSIO 43136]|uniref:FAD-dependent oxidoreductase n=1 Tax=Vibrio sp. SCSIO 43136 TaxID=2819101 RepID=UPI002074C590|nr:FAD-dependent oxidoreductase [Vibrio sp. SCSIO 43136]USD66742.1 FAD-dependent oxidoreductase [Vibrio sp. SCSIO 43136]
MSSKSLSPNNKSVVVIGGGIAGSTAALALAEKGVPVTLLERKNGLVSGPPICHLHAGGNLYREISQQQCITLLRQSIDTVRVFKHTLNVRPTVIAIPHTDPCDPNSLLPRLKAIQSSYQALVDQDPENEVLGAPKNYFKLYSKSDLEQLKGRMQPSSPVSTDDWLIPFAQFADLETLKYPVVAVEEHGWSVFRLAATSTIALENLPSCELKLEANVEKVTELDDGRWQVCFQDSEGFHQREFDYLINACGFETGTVDDWAGKKRQRLVEFKAAYVTQWQSMKMQWPEVIFHGPRGTPQGMAQFTPYPGGVFQLHGMTHDVTLFEDGLVSSNEGSAQPKLPQKFINKVYKGWSEEVLTQRTQRAIEHISQFIPSFSGASVAGQPLFGAQQIPGDDVTLRAADVSFCGDNYARLEVVKGSSVLDAAQQIINTLVKLDYCANTCMEFPQTSQLTLPLIEERACELAVSRGYPVELAQSIDC